LGTICSKVFQAIGCCKDAYKQPHGTHLPGAGSAAANGEAGFHRASADHSPFTYSMCCALLCCAVLCCAVLCCAVLCCAVLCCALLCCAVIASAFPSFLPLFVPDFVLCSVWLQIRCVCARYHSLSPSSIVLC
jgi:hypothetical protein